MTEPSDLKLVVDSEAVEAVLEQLRDELATLPNPTTHTDLEPLLRRWLAKMLRLARAQQRLEVETVSFRPRPG